MNDYLKNQNSFWEVVDSDLNHHHHHHQQQHHFVVDFHDNLFPVLLNDSDFVKFFHAQLMLSADFEDWNPLTLSDKIKQHQPKEEVPDNL